MATALTALGSARSYLNDIGAQIWTDTVLMPYLQEAYRDLLSILWLNGLSVIREKSASIIVNAGVLQLPLPSNFIAPIWLKERAHGSTEDWQPMTESEFEPDYPQQNTLIYWAWRREQIEFVGATTSRDVLMQFYYSLTMPAVSGDSLGFMFAENFLGPQTAAYAANSVGNSTLAKELMYVENVNMGIAGSRLDMLIRSNVKGQQNLPARRIPYRRLSRTQLLF